jgi:hypothetical protein
MRQRLLRLEHLDLRGVEVRDADLCPFLRHLQAPLTTLKVLPHDS